MNINPMLNYYFMLASAVMVIFVGTWITEKIVEPRLDKYKGKEKPLEIEQLTLLEKKGLRWAGIGTLIFIAAMAWTIIPENGLFRDPETAGILQSPFFSGIIVGLLLLFFVPGMIYCIIVKTIINDMEVVLLSFSCWLTSI